MVTAEKHPFEPEAPVAEQPSGPRGLDSRSLMLIGAKIALSLGLLIFALNRVDFDQVRASLTGFKAIYLLPIFGIFLLHIILSGVRWYIIATIYGRRARIRWYMVRTSIAYFLNQFMVGTVGGDVYRVACMKYRGFLMREAVSVILIERIAILLTLGVMVLMTLPFAYAKAGDRGMAAAMFVIGMICLVFGLKLAHSVANDPYWERLVPWQRAYELVREMSQVLMTSFKVPMCNVASFTILASSVVIYWLASRGLGFETSLLSYIMIAPAAIFVAMLPITIGGWGARELAFGTGLALLGGNYTEGVVVSAVVGLLMFAVGIPGFFAFLFQRYIDIDEPLDPQPTPQPG